MASIFDFFSTLNTTPRGSQGLMRIAADNPPTRILEGEYIPRSEGTPDSTQRPRLSVDPVAEQYGSRVDPNAKSGTMYGGRDGGVSTNPEDVRRKPSAHARWNPVGEHPDAPKARGVDFKGVPETRPDMPTPAKAAGLIGKFAKVAGPAGLIYDTLNPQMLDDGELTRAQQEAQAQAAVGNMAPQVARDALQFGQGVADRAVNQAMGRGNPLDLTDPQAPRGNLFSQAMSPREEVAQDAARPAVEQTPMGPVAQAAPTTPSQAAATTVQQMEGQRQTMEDQTVKALETNQISRPQAAQAVVQADAQKAGKELTPEQNKQAVATELANMKSMDNSQVGKYLSYALVGLGLVGSVLDKSGQTSQNFSNSFNKQLDRNLAQGKANQAARIKQAEMEAAAKQNEIKNAQGDRRLDQGDTKLKQDLGIAEGRQRVAEGGLKLGYDRLSETQRSNQVSEAQGAARLGQGAARLAQDQAQYEGLMGFKDRQQDATEAENASKAARRADQTRQGNENLLIKAKKASQDTAKGADLSTKDSEGLAKAAADSAGRNLSENAKSALGQQIRFAAKQDPRGFAKDPVGFVQKLMQAGYVEKPGGLFGFGDPTIDISQ